MLNVLSFVADVEEVPPGLDGEGAVGDGELPDAAPRRAPSDGEHDDDRPAVPARFAAASEPMAGRSYLYDEWDHLGQRYLSAWCRVNERPLRGGDPNFIVDVRRRHASAHPSGAPPVRPDHAADLAADAARARRRRARPRRGRRRDGRPARRHDRRRPPARALGPRGARGGRGVPAGHELVDVDPDLAATPATAGRARGARHDPVPRLAVGRGRAPAADRTDGARRGQGVVGGDLRRAAPARRRARDLRLQRFRARRRRAVRGQGLRRDAVGAHVGPARGDAAAFVHQDGPGDPPRHRPPAPARGAHPVPRGGLRRLPAGPRLRPDARRFQPTASPTRPRRWRRPSGTAS